MTAVAVMEINHFLKSTVLLGDRIAKSSVECEVHIKDIDAVRIYIHYYLPSSLEKGSRSVVQSVSSLYRLSFNKL